MKEYSVVQDHVVMEELGIRGRGQGATRLIPRAIPFEDGGVILVLKECWSAVRNFGCRPGMAALVYGDGPAALALARFLRLEDAQGVAPIRADVVYEWPKDKTILDGAATIVFTGDLFPGATLENSEEVMADLAGLMDRGRGMVCLHFATGLREQQMKEGEDHPLVRWIGGCFYKGVARVVTATLTPEPVDHPALRGWKEFTFEDEAYWNNYFGKDGPAKNVTRLVAAMLPPQAPTKQVVAWAVKRADGGRGVGMAVSCSCPRTRQTRFAAMSSPAAWATLCRARPAGAWMEFSVPIS